MTPIVEDAQLSTDLDCQWNTLQRIRNFHPVPGNLVHIDDPRLSDPRNMLDGSVINESVANNAAIVQSKLNLNGVMPPAWFSPPGPPPAGADIDAPAPPVWAARGDLAELLQRKGAPNGYAAVDDNLRLLPENVTPGPGLGTVSEVLMSFPEQFGDLAPAAGASVNYNLTWKNVPNNSWFGVFGDVGAGIGMGPGIGADPTSTPAFHVEQFPVDFIPDLDASKFTSGTFPPDTLPVAIGFGPDHAPGMVPDPGDLGDGDADEYLGRDMEYHHFDEHHFYQPKMIEPSITLISLVGDRAEIVIRTEIAGALLFYRWGRPTFRECPTEFHITTTRGTTVEAYTAKEGYNNSSITSYTVPLDDVPGPDEPDFIGNISEA